MGGSIFPGTVRLPLSDYEAFKTHVLSHLAAPANDPLDLCPNSAFPPAALAVPPHYADKTDFGDLDVVAGPTGWEIPLDGSASWEAGQPVVDDGVGGRTQDWVRRLGAVRWKRSGPILSFAIPLSVFLPTPPTQSLKSAASTPPLAQIDLLLIPSAPQIPLETLRLAYSGLGLLLAIPLRKLTHHQLILSHASLTLTHDFPHPALFGTSTTVPLPPLEMALSHDVGDVCRTLGLDEGWWAERKDGEIEVVQEDVFRWVLGQEAGFIRRGWEQVLASSEIVEVAPATTTPSLLTLASRDPSHPPKPLNSKQRAKLKIPLYQAFLAWLRAHPLASGAPSASPSPTPPPPATFHHLNPETYHILSTLPSSSSDPQSSLPGRYLVVLASHEQENAALVRRRRTNLALSGGKVMAWVPGIPPGRVSLVMQRVKEMVGEGWLGDEGRTEEDVAGVVRGIWEGLQAE